MKANAGDYQRPCRQAFTGATPESRTMLSGDPERSVEADLIRTSLACLEHATHAADTGLGGITMSRSRRIAWWGREQVAAALAGMVLMLSAGEVSHAGSPNGYHGGLSSHPHAGLTIRHSR